MCASTKSRNSTGAAMTTFMPTLVRLAARTPPRQWWWPRCLLSEYHSAGRSSTLRRAPVSALEHLAQHVRQDPAMPVVGRLRRGVDPHPGGQVPYLAVGLDPDGDLAGQLLGVLEPGDGVGLLTGQAQLFGGLTGLKLQGEYAHADQVGAVDPLE